MRTLTSSALSTALAALPDVGPDGPRVRETFGISLADLAARTGLLLP